MTTSTFLLFHGGWHLARPGAIGDFRSDADEPGALRLAWFDAVTDGHICWDGEPTVVRELTEDGSVVAERPCPTPLHTPATWQDWSPVEAGGYPAVLDSTTVIDVCFRGTRTIKNAVRRDDVNWNTIYQWRRHTG